MVNFEDYPLGTQVRVRKEWSGDVPVGTIGTVIESDGRRVMINFGLDTTSFYCDEDFAYIELIGGPW